MNIIFPINGLGKRFENEGYNKPKPLIPINGTPMFSLVLENLTFDPSDQVYIIYNRILSNFQFEDLIRERANFGALRQDNIHFVKLNKDTNGAVETILEGVGGLNLTGETLFLDCDTIYFDDVLSWARNSQRSKIFYSVKDENEKPIYSYIQTDRANGRVLSIKEKVKISNFANTGAYFFNDFKLFQEVGRKLISNKERQNNEYYISGVYNDIIERGEWVASQEVGSFSCVGTPLELRQHCLAYGGDSKKFCFDLDNTLVTYPKTKGNYDTCEPIQKNINLLNFLHRNGHHIIVYTARRMRTHKGNVGAVVADIGETTINSLKKFKINYDELVFGKPHADFYIDDLAINAGYDNIEKEIGVYQNEVESRAFHRVVIENDRVIKEGNDLSGEAHWYEEMDFGSERPRFWPKTFEISKSKIVMEKINGISFSHLYINGGMTRELLEKLMGSVTILHTNGSLLKSNREVCDFYIDKLQERYDKLHTFNYLTSKYYIYFMNYFSKKRLTLGNETVFTIHGDPVFTNVIINSEKHIYLIDPRGKWGNELTVFGDLNYDYAKILQSILGYDFIINNLEVNKKIVNNGISYFESIFGENRLEEVRVIALYLIFTLIPLHDESKQQKFLDLIEENWED